MTHDEAVEIVRSFTPKKHVPALIEQLRPSIRIHTRRIDQNKLNIGASRIGGLPDLPPDLPWPTWNASVPDYKSTERKRIAKGKVALNFIAQIRMSELPEMLRIAEMPTEGMLYFFYDIEQQADGHDPLDAGAWRVLHWPNENGPFVRRRNPFESEHDRSSSCQLKFESEWTLPQYPFVEWSPELFDEKTRVEVRLAGGIGHGWGESIHRMFGHAQNVQGEMQIVCQLASHGIRCGNPADYQSARAMELTAGISEWQLLLQIDTDEFGPGWMWGDTGSIYYWMRRQEWKKKSFDKCWFVFQCH